MIAQEAQEVRIGDYTLVLSPSDDPAQVQLSIVGPDQDLADRISQDFDILCRTKHGRRLVWELLTTTQAQIRQQDIEDLADALNIPPEYAE